MTTPNEANGSRAKTMGEQFKEGMTQVGLAFCNPVVLGFAGGMIVAHFVFG